jgi:hypothetical protein
LGDAFRIVGAVCSQCHKVGDFVPEGLPIAWAPNLDKVHQRLRPTFLRDWIANPKMFLPYTNMPQNIPHRSITNRNLYDGTSVEQLDATVDLLMNYDQYIRGAAPVKDEIERLKKIAGPKEGETTTDPPDKKELE